MREKMWFLLSIVKGDLLFWGGADILASGPFLRISTILKTETSSRDDAAKTFFRAALPP